MGSASLDPTAALASMALHVLIAVALVLYSRFQRHYSGFFAWAAGMGCVALGFLAMSARPLGVAFSVAVASGFLLAGILLELEGTLRFATGRRLALAWYLLPPAAAALQAWTSTYDAAARQWVFALPASVLLFLVVRTLVRNAPPGQEGLYRVVASVRVVVGSMILARAVLASLVGDPSSLETMGVEMYLGVCATSTLEMAGYLWLAGRRAEAELVELHESLRTTLESLTASEAELEALSGLLHLCPKCHRIEDAAGGWQRVEAYVQARTEATFSHGICPACMELHYSDLG